MGPPAPNDTLVVKAAAEVTQGYVARCSLFLQERLPSLPGRACGEGSVEHRDSGRTGLCSSTQTTPSIFMLKDRVGHYEVGASQVSSEILEGFHNKESRRKRTAWPFSTGVEY